MPCIFPVLGASEKPYWAELGEGGGSQDDKGVWGQILE